LIGSRYIDYLISVTEEFHPEFAFKDNLQINGLPASKTRLTVIDYSGLIKTSKEINSTNYNWNISSLKPGNYILRIESNGTSTSIKFLKE